MEQKNQQVEQALQTDDKRLPYEKPGVLSEEVFETLALSCHSTHPFFCDPNNEPGGS